MLKELYNELKGQGIILNFASVKGPVRDYFAQCGVTDLMGKDKFFLGVQAAIDAFDQDKSLWVERSNLYAQQVNCV
jgi:SulP family sulfate permease